MTRDETLAIMAVLRTAYPNFYRGMTPVDVKSIVSLWETMFADDPAELVTLAVKRHIATDKKGFPPHIGAIKAAIVELTKSADLEMSEMEAWQLVLKAIRNSTYGSEREFAALPAIVQRLVGSPNQLREWGMMDSDTVQSVVASNFQRSYRARAANEREALALPKDVREAMRQLSGRMTLEIGVGG